MNITQARLPNGLIREMDDLVKTGIYTNRSDVIRQAVRKLVIENKIEKLIGSIKNTGDSVKEVREIRKILSKQITSLKDIEEINKLAD